MGMPNFELMEFPNDSAGNAIAGTGKEVNASDLVAGYDFTRGTGAYTGVLEGSVGGQQWDDIVSLAASDQGVIPAHYNVVRIKVTVGGAIGTSRLGYHGKS